MFTEDITLVCDKKNLSLCCIHGIAILPFSHFCSQGNQEQPLILWPLGIIPGNCSNSHCDLGSPSLALQSRLDHKNAFLPQIKTRSVWVSVYFWLLYVAFLVVSSDTGRQWAPSIMGPEILPENARIFQFRNHIGRIDVVGMGDAHYSKSVLWRGDWAHRHMELWDIL